MNVFKSQKKKVSCKHRMDCPGIFNWHSKHNTKYSVLWKHKRGLPNGTQMKKCKNTPFGRPYKGKEVLLWKAGKVMVRLSIVKIEVWPFKTLFIYSYTLSLIPLGHLFFLLYRQVNVGRHWPGRPVEAASRRWRRAGLQPPSEMRVLSCYMIQKVRLIFSDTEWQAVKSKNDTSKLGSAGSPIRSPNGSSYLHNWPRWGRGGGSGGLSVLRSHSSWNASGEHFEMASSKATCCWCLSHFKKKEMLQHKFPALKEEKFWIESDVKRRPG